MKRGSVVAAIVCAVGVLGAGTAVARPEPTVCTGAVGEVLIDGDVIAEVGCDLSNATVMGNVWVTPGGSLIVIPGATNTRIYGDVKSLQAARIEIRAGWIGGDVKLGDTDFGVNGLLLENSRVRGDVIIAKGSSFLHVLSMEIGGSVLVYGATGSDPTGQFGFVIGVLGSTVGGNVLVYDNEAVGSVWNQIVVARNEIGGSALVHQNVSRGGTQENTVKVYENKVGDGLVVSSNRAEGSAPDIFVDVSGNVVARTLSCRDNTPPATNGFAGENTARRKRGECADL
jgi:hypothetical protein